MVTNKRRRALSALSGITIATIVLGGTTTALWNDATNFDGAVITAGNLDVDKLGDMRWSDVSGDKAASPIDPTKFKIVPGDTVIADRDIDVALEGDNMQAMMGVKLLSPSTGDLLSIPNGVDATYSVLDENGKTVIPDTPVNAPKSPEAHILPENVSGVDLDGIKDYTFRIKLNFDENTSGQTRTQTVAELGSWNYYLNQVREVPAVPDDPCVLNYDISCEIEPLYVVPTYQLIDTNDDGVANPGEQIVFIYNIYSNVKYPISHAQVTESTLLTQPFTIENISLPAKGKVVRKYTYTVTDKDSARGVFTSTATPSMTRPGDWKGNPKKTELRVFSAPELPVWMYRTQFSTDRGALGLLNLGDTLNYTYGVGAYRHSGNQPTNIQVHTQWGDVVKVSNPSIYNYSTADSSHTFTATDLDGKTESGFEHTPYVTADSTCIDGSTCTIVYPIKPFTVPVQNMTSSATFGQSYSITRDFAPKGVVSLGDEVTFTYTQKNTGTTPLNNLRFKGLPETDGNVVSVLNTADSPLGNTAAWSPKHTVTQADVDAGMLTQSGHVDYAPSYCGGTTSNCAEKGHDYAVFNLPVMQVVQATTPADVMFDVSSFIVEDLYPKGAVNSGDTIRNSYTIVNTGVTSIKAGTVVTDSRGATFTLPVELTSGSSKTFQNNYVATISDVSGGAFVTTANANYTPFFCDGRVSDSCDSLNVSGSTSIVSAKLASDFTVSLSDTISPDSAPTGTLNAGDVWILSYAVKNNGTTKLVGGHIDSKDSWNSGNVSEVNPGTTQTFSFSHTVSAEEAKSGKLNTSATVSFTPQTCATETCVEQTSPVLSASKTTVAPAGDFSVEFASQQKISDIAPAGANNPGDTIRTTYKVTNTSNYTFVVPRGMTSNGWFAGASGDKQNRQMIINPGEFLNVSTNHLLTKDDLTNGASYVDSVRVGIDGLLACDSVDASGVCPTVVKMANAPALTLVAADVAPGHDSVPFEASVMFSNDRSTFGRPNKIIEPGDTVTYKYVAGGLYGDYIASDVKVSDSFGNVYPVDFTSTPGNPRTFTFSHTFTAEELNGKTDFVNTVKIFGKSPFGENLTWKTVPVSMPVSPLSSGISDSLTYSIDPDYAPVGTLNAGETITFSAIVTNTNTIPVTVSAPTATLDSFGSTSPVTLFAGESQKWTISHKVTVAEAASGALSQTTGFTYQYSYGCGSTCPQIASQKRSVAIETVAASSTAKVDVVTTIVPDFDPVGSVNPAESLRSLLTLTNTGTVGIARNAFVRVVEENKIYSISNNVIEPGASAKQISGAMSFVPTAAEKAAGKMTRTLVSTYIPQACSTPDSSGNCASISLTKTVSAQLIPVSADLSITQTDRIIGDGVPAGELNVGETWELTYKVKNNSTVQMNNVNVSSNNSWGTKVISSLNPGQEVTIVVTHEITPDDLSESPYSLVSASGIPTMCVAGTTCAKIYSDGNRLDRVGKPFDPKTSISASFKSMEITKDNGVIGEVNPGDEVTYTWGVTNGGTYTHAANGGVVYSVTPTKGAVVNSTVANPAGTTADVKTVYVATAADATAGKISNSITATFVPKYCDPQLSPCATLTANAAATDVVVKSVPTDFEPTITAVITTDKGTVGKADVGDIVTVTVNATNTGGSNLNPSYSVSLSLDGAAVVKNTTAINPNTPGKTGTVVYTYTVTAVGAASGSVSFNATVANAQAAPCSTTPCPTVSKTVSTSIDSVPMVNSVALEPGNFKLTTDVNGDGIAQAGDVITYNQIIVNNSNYDIVSGWNGGYDIVRGNTTETISASTPTTNILSGTKYTATNRTFTVTPDMIDTDGMIRQKISYWYQPSFCAPQTLPCPKVVSNFLESDIKAEQVRNEVRLTSSSFKLSKDINGDGIAQPGDTVTWSMSRKNTGNVDMPANRLSKLLVSINGVNLNEDSTYSTLATPIGSTVNYSARSYTVTSDMITEDGFLKQETKWWWVPLYCSPQKNPCDAVYALDEPVMVMPAAQVKNSINVTPSLEIVTNASSTFNTFNVGDVVRYKYVVTNTGGSAVRVKGFTSSLPEGNATTSTVVNPGTPVTIYSPNFTLTEDHRASGMLINSVVGTGTPSSCYPVVSPCPDVNSDLATIATQIFPATYMQQYQFTAANDTSAFSDFGGAYNSTNNSYYMFSGSINWSSHLNTYRYDPVTNTRQYVSGGNFPGVRRYNTAVYVPSQNAAFVFGGSTNPDSYGATNSIYKVTFTGDTSATVVSYGLLPVPAINMRSVYNPADGMIYLFGGQNGDTNLSTIYKYNPVTGATSTVGPMGGGLIGQFQAVYDPESGKIFVFGSNNIMSVFDPTTGSMAFVANSPTSRYNPSMDYDPINKKIVLMGGAVGPNAVKTIEIFDPAARKFTDTVGSMFTNRGNYGYFYYPITKMMYALGGWAGGSEMTNTIEAVSLQ